MSIKVRVSGAPGFADFTGTLVPGGDIREVDSRGPLSVVLNEDGEPQVVPSRTVERLPEQYIEILIDGHDCAGVKAGDRLRVKHVEGSTVWTDAPTLSEPNPGWTFTFSSENVGWRWVNNPVPSDWRSPLQESMDRRG